MSRIWTLVMAFAMMVGGALGGNAPVMAQTVAPMQPQSTVQPAGPTLVPAPTMAPQMQPGVAEPYRINAGDELSVYVWGEDRLQREVRVLPDGTFAFPLVGQVNAQGRLPQEIESIITERLRDQYRGQVPQVTVSVKAATGLQFSVMGRVKSPGTFSPGRYINVLEALSMAGGPTEFANLDGVIVLRKRGDRIQTIKVRLGSTFRSGSSDRANVVRIETGDTVIVP